MKNFNMLPSSVKDKPLDDMYIDQKKMIALMVSESMDIKNFGKSEKFRKESEKIYSANSEKEWIKQDILHPVMIEKLKESRDKESAEKEIKRRADIIKDQKIEDIRKKIFGEE